MAGHAQLKFVLTECSKTHIRLTGLIYDFTESFKNFQSSSRGIVQAKFKIRTCKRFHEVFVTSSKLSTKYMSRVKRICVFEHSVMTHFNCACPAIQRGQGSGFLSEGSSWLLLVWASSEGSGETARMRRLAWTFAARIGDKYQIRLTRSIRSRYTGCMHLRKNIVCSNLERCIKIKQPCSDLRDYQMHLHHVKQVDWRRMR